jgi:nucleoid-associated protein YgaU
MTKEAKVGLLLGLGFIVAISVVLRDVHQTGMDEPVITDLSSSENSVLEPEQMPVAVKKLSPPEEFPVDVIMPDVGQQNDDVAVEREDIDSQKELLAIAQNQQEPRYEGPLPGLPGFVTILAESPGDEKLTADGKSPVYPQPLGANSPSHTVKPPKQPGMDSYVVSDGDSLSKIAIKFYGPVEGKQWVNIVKIQQTNRNLIQSTDDILQVGQKLQIPPIVGQPGEPTTGREIDRGVDREKKVTQTEQADYRYYVVEEGDSLWGVAQEKLGNGNRFVEIKRLNDKVIKNDDRIYTGMRLRLPKK